MIGLGIESSCDETAIAIVKDGTKCLSNIISSQIEMHAPFNGVVPEIASRAHLEKINFVYEKALAEAGCSLGEIDYIAVTVKPGLLGSLMMGASFAKSLALVSGLPIVKIDHVEAHLYAPFLEVPRPSYPFLGLLLSGGNSALYLVKGLGELEVIADTMDDACGEAFDKVATSLGLEPAYPGGPVVEKKAKEYKNNENSPLFKPLLKGRNASEIAFSFSGIKTAVIYAHQKGFSVDRICHDFQATVFELIERNLKNASQRTGIKTIVAGGGVLANSSLQNRLAILAQRENIKLICPQNKILCTDNAAMVAVLGYFIYESLGKNSHTKIKELYALDFEVDSKR